MGDSQHQARQAYKVKLSGKPCVIRYVESFKGFIVGTYDLLPNILSARARFPELSDEELLDKYHSINKRVGSLNFLRPTSEVGSSDFKLSETLQCHHGGVFDMSVVNESIYVAHANGFIALFEFDHLRFRCRESIQVTSVNSTLLTSIDTCQQIDHSPLVVVGDSMGYMTIIEGSSANTKLDKILSTCHVTKYADPLWQVKILPPSPVTEFIILVGAEDSSWYIYKFEIKSEESSSSLQLLAKNRDFEAGVTSICLLPKRVIVSGSLIFRLMLGSYDESIRAYEIKICSNCESGDIKSLFKTPIKIQGGGIWRIEENDEKCLFYIAAMYAGTYQIKLCDLYDNQTIEPLEIKFDEAYSSMDDNKLEPLHYGVDYSNKHSVACIVDYNNNCCIFVSQ